MATLLDLEVARQMAHQEEEVQNQALLQVEVSEAQQAVLHQSEWDP